MKNYTKFINQNLIVFMNDETDEKYLRLNMYF